MNTLITQPSANNSLTKANKLAKYACHGLLVGALATAPSAMAAVDNTKPAKAHSEIMGFGIGTIIGGVLGGPAGAFITGLAASLMVKTENQKDHATQLSAALSAKEQEQQTQVANFKSQVQQLEQNYQRELLSQEQQFDKVGKLQLANLMMSLQFATGSSDIALPYHQQIKALAAILTQAPAVKIELSGYTDKQGTDKLNQALSLARANSVKSALVSEGIDASRISTFAYGDTATLMATNGKKASFFDRRVVIKLHQDNGITAKN